MCYNHQEEWRREGNNHTPPPSATRRQAAAAAAAARSAALVDNLRDRLAETELRLQQARAREAELSRQLFEMKRCVSVMEILESYLRRRFHEQQDLLARLLSAFLQI
ncbi:protein SKIP34 isoform X2 [Beta vulgaris subsp. vulgaris]|uniref:protein SKIP34 isoform X2 n=1 Tax=Beta vulgaris subsp. vulgaris TaxID=3555 RepID=UPI00203733A3|nr:protein SKIP34 isoform X2 [Beta vulgaris subsp. vulgaris]